MAKNEYIGVNNVARKVSQPYIGVNNVARKVKSGFIGVNGVARQYYESVVYNTWKKYSFASADFYYKRDFVTISGGTNDYSSWYWMFPCTNNVSTIIAPQGTYPDSGYIRMVAFI